jgi:hypothetical protein
MDYYAPPKIPDTFATDAEVTQGDANTSSQIPVHLPPLPASVVRGVTITASSTYSPPFSPENVFNTTPGIQWANDQTVPDLENPQTLTIKYDEPQTIEGYRLLRGQNPGQHIISWDIETSVDGTAWVLRDSKRNIAAIPGHDEKFWTRPVEKELFIRIRCLELVAGGAFRFVGIGEFFGVLNAKTLLVGRKKVVQVAHGFTGPSAAYIENGLYKPADRNSTTIIAQEFISRVFDNDSFEVLTQPGEYNIVIPDATENGWVYQGAALGSLTGVPPTTGQRVIKMGRFIGRGKVYYAPSTIAELA